MSRPPIAIADKLSRLEQFDIEWDLDDIYYREIVQKFTRPTIDIFAIKDYTKYSRFACWKPVREASFIDAFTICWSEFYFYAFPPFAMILRALSKIKKEKAYGIIIAPRWKTHPWFPLFLRLAVDKPLIFRPNNNLLLSPCRTKIHPRAKHLCLIANRISGRHL